ncbi:hypothetical protein GCM10025857_16880 [Alicyclobacillus contaminans]|nr:hypothetical protein GCM10025857_16880 [Alicyclobacillus contaminans]
MSGIQLPLNAALALGQESDTVSAPGNPTTYTVTSYELTNPEAVLSHLPPLSSPRAQAFPEDIRDTYTQLPELPDRVFKLANQLAGQSVDEYQIVENVLTYLQTHYPYETEDIPRPGANQDYVDQFLFDSRRGYCNNFSSAMAVLLRCVGIPTRWVTGFATGDIDASYSGPGQRYIYRNADAHSWVEVYFPNVGWIPFDPTPTFTFPFLPASTSDKPVPVTPPSPSVNTTNPKPVVKPTPAPKDSTVAASSSVNRGRIGRWILDGVAGILAAAVLMLLALRRPVRVWWVQRMWRQPAAALLTPAMRRLTRLLQRAGLAEPASTLRDLEVAARQHGIAPDDYRQLVTTTEAHWYGGKPIPPQEIERTHRTWLAWVRAALVHPQQRSQRTARKKDSVDETMDET